MVSEKVPFYIRDGADCANLCRYATLHEVGQDRIVGPCVTGDCDLFSKQIVRGGLGYQRTATDTADLFRRKKVRRGRDSNP